MKSDHDSREDEGGHMSSTAGRVKRVAGAHVPYVVTLMHQGCEASEHAFATMREAEAFIKRNTPVPGANLRTTYDRPAAATGEPKAGGVSHTHDKTILTRLKVIGRRLRQISTEEAASVLAGGMANAGIDHREQLRLVAATERILDQLDGNKGD